MVKMQFKVEDPIQLSNLLEVLSELGYSYNSTFIGEHNYPFYIQTWGDKRLTADDTEFEPLEWTLINTGQFIISGGNIVQPVVTPATTREEFWTDKHYNFDFTTPSGNVVKVDPYFVANQWKLGEKDNSGVLFHILKTIARFGDKNPREREVKAIYAQIKRLAELEGIEL